MPYQPTWNNQYLGNPGLPSIQIPQPLSQPQQSVNGIIQVNGRDSAMQYQLPPNSTSPALFDNDGKTFYVVTTDGTGARTVEAFDYVPHKQEPTINASDLVTRVEFDGLVNKVNQMMGVLNGVHGQVQQAAEPTSDNGLVTAGQADCRQ